VNHSLSDSMGVAYKPTGDRTKRIYHTQRDCRNFPDEYAEVNRESIDEYGWRECKFCSGESKEQPDKQGEQLAAKIRNSPQTDAQ